MPTPEEIKQALVFMTTADTLKAKAETYYSHARRILEGVYPPDSLSEAEQTKGLVQLVGRQVGRREQFRMKSKK